MAAVVSQYSANGPGQVAGPVDGTVNSGLYQEKFTGRYQGIFPRLEFKRRWELEARQKTEVHVFLPTQIICFMGLSLSDVMTCVITVLSKE